MSAPLPPLDHPLVLDYRLTVEDRVAWQLWHLEHSGGLKRIRRKVWWTQLGVLMLVFPFPISMVLPRTTTGTLVVLAVIVFVAVVFAGITAVLPDHTESDARRRLTKRLGRVSPAAVPARLWLDETGIGTQQDAGTQHRAWHVLRGVEETPDHLFVRTGETTAIVVPKRADPILVKAIADRLRFRSGLPPLQPAQPAGPTRAEPTEPTVAPTWGRPTDWVLPDGVVPLSAFGRPAGTTQPLSPQPDGMPPGARSSGSPLPGEPMLSFRVGLGDVMAARLDHPAARARYAKAIAETNRRALWRLVGRSFPMLLLFNLFALRLGVWRSLGFAVVFVGVAALGRLGWTARVVKTKLPPLVEEQARHELAAGGDQRWLWADSSGIRVADAAASWQSRWEQVTLCDTNTHVLVHATMGSLAIPKTVGRPLAVFLGLAKGKVAWS